MSSSGNVLVRIALKGHPRMLIKREAHPIISVRYMGLVTRNWGNHIFICCMCLKFVGAERKRFFRQVTVQETEDGEYGIKLDQRNLRTPLRKVFTVPNYSLALLTAQEWAGQEGVVTPSLMHLTSMCNTVLDNPKQQTREQRVEGILEYLQGDTIRFVISWQSGGPR